MTLKLPTTRLKAIIAALVVILLAIGLFVWSAHVKSGSTGEKVLDSFAITLVAIGVIGVIYDWALRRTLASEILAAVRLQTRVVETGIADISKSEPDWAACLVENLG